MSNITSLAWFVQIALTVFASVLMHKFGWFEMMYHTDQTKISIVIIVLFIICSGTIGYLSFKPRNYKIIEKLSNYVWFGSETMTTLGMIGTVAGFLIMLGTAFSSLNLDSKTNIQEAIHFMAIGMSTALVTTLVGLVCSTLTKIQMVIYEQRSNNLK